MPKCAGCLVLLLLLAGAGRADAQVAPLVPIGAAAPLPPLVPLTPVQSQLNTTYRAIQSAGGSNATLAARAAYAEAIARFHAGDPSGAAADAAWARAQLGNSGPPALSPLAPLPALPGKVDSPSPVSSLEEPAPLIGNGAALPPYFTHARDTVLDARFSSERTRNEAFAALRNALDAWLNGDAAGSKREAARAETLASPRR
jgi:hypothetical protein